VPAKRLQLALVTAVLSGLGGIAIAASGEGLSAGDGRAGSSSSGSAAQSRSDLANRCFALAAAVDGRYVAIRDGGYRAEVRSRSRAAAFYLKPTGLGTHLLQDQERMLLGVGAGDEVDRAEQPGEHAEWRIRRSPRGSFALTSTSTGRQLAVEPETGRLVFAGAGAGARRGFEFGSARGCSRFPEARAGASGRPFAGTNADGTVLGFADLHLHVTANLRAGGRVIHGESFHRFGVAEALGHDERNHGPDGSLDVTGNLLRTGSPAGTHDTHGWPTFVGWPVHDTYTHQQAYYVWLKRVWKAGLRLVVAQAIEDEALCELEPRKAHSCDETETVKLEIRQLRALENYVDAQSGGRGRGWLRIVTDPRQARRVIERGKLAVVIGMETSSPLGCSEFQGQPQCTREDIDRVLGQLHRLGVRSMFVAHWVDNAFGGAALQSGAEGDFISVFETYTTGHPFETEPCGEADEAEGRCNAKGLTDLGRYLIRRMMDKHMLIEADHLSQKARESVLAIAERKRYPLVSSHTGTGGEWTAAQLRRLYALGGLASATPDTAPEMVGRILPLQRQGGRGRHAAVALGTDTGGFAALPGPRGGGRTKLRYPFTSYDGEVEFVRQRTGRRVFDLNTDGVAHYGLFADLIADMQRQRRGSRALRSLFGSAEAYLRTWARTYRRR
jgi:microsomal dipeptidase-like Zn-dependent dipeptidase